MSGSNKDDLRPEYDLDQLRGRARGKYQKSCEDSSNVVVIESDLTNEFPNTKAVNDALRELLKLRKTKMR